MFAYEFSTTLEQELSEIPAEYQEAFRHAIEQELLEGEHDRTDTDRLHYLRQRRTAFEQGSFLRPDGRPGMVPLSAEALYEQGFADLIHPQAGSDGAQSERRRTLLKVAGLSCLLLLFLLWAVRSRARRADAKAATPTATAVVAAASALPEPTPSLPAVTALSGADETLKTVGGLGGTLTLGRPSSLELAYAASEETIALPIDPSRPTNKGELRYDEARMLSDNPVAVWLFGTVLNYAIGVPDTLVRNLQTGDRLTVNTDTGAVLHFVVSQRWTGANHETGRWLSQNRTGLTLFALPAAAETEVAFVFAHYDLMHEATAATPLYGIGDKIPLAQNDTFEISALRYDHTDTGELQLTLTGKATVTTGAAQPLWLALSASWGQSDALALTVSAAGAWTATYRVPAAAVGAPLFAELRLLPTQVVTVALGDVPALPDLLELSVTDALWQPEQQTVAIALTVHNPTPSNIFLSSDQFSIQGGDALDPIQQTTARLQPQQQLRTQLLLRPPSRFLLSGATETLTLTFLPTQPSDQLQIRNEQWEISDIPIVRP